jgi:hypothetical protein
MYPIGEKIRPEPANLTNQISLDQIKARPEERRQTLRELKEHQKAEEALKEYLKLEKLLKEKPTKVQ